MSNSLTSIPELPERLSLGRLATPLQPLDRLSELCGGPRIWIKRDDMTGCVISGNKVRKLEFLLADALNSQCDTIITCGGIQSNHCRATAILGAQLGMQVRLLLRSDEKPKIVGNLFLGALVGAKICHYSKAEYQDLDYHVKEWINHYSERGHTPYFIPTGGSNILGLNGYIQVARELALDFAENGIQPSSIVHATGSGGTQAGLILGCKIHNINTAVIGFAVCDDEKYFIQKISTDIDGWCRLNFWDGKITDSDIQVIDSYKKPRYGICPPEVKQCIQMLGALEGIILDPVYTGKAFYGMLKEIEFGRFDNAADIVFIHTGGIFGLFAQHKSFKLKKENIV